MALILRPAETSFSIPERLDSLARWTRLWSIVTGMAILIAFAAITVAVAFGLDLVFTLPGIVRALFLLIFLAGMVLIVHLRIRIPWQNRPGSMEVAFALENSNPELNDVLASALAFSKTPDDDAVEFRRAAMKQAERLTEPLSWNSVLRVGRFWQAFWLAVPGCAVLVAIGIPNASLLPTAVLRLVDPWGHHAWPARTVIELDPFNDRIAVGDPWSLNFNIRGWLPESGCVQFRTSTFTFDETLSFHTENESKATAHIVLDASRTAMDFQFRIQAGDAETPWRSVTVSPPPRLVMIDGHPSPRFRVTYPSYTGWHALELPDGTVSLEAVAGTRISFRARTDRAIANAVLLPQGDPQNYIPCQAVAAFGATPLMESIASVWMATATQELASYFTREIPVAVSGSERSDLSIEFIPPQSGLYALRFTDESGLTGQRLFEFRSFADPSPAVALLRPDPSRDTLDLLATGSFSFEIQSEDRTFAARMLAVEYRFDDEPWQNKRLVDLRDQAALIPALTGAMVPFSVTHPQTLMHRDHFRLSQFLHADGRAPKPGDVLTIRGAAQDWDDVSILKAPGRTADATIHVHSVETLEAELQRQLASLREPLKAAADAQTSAAEKAKSASLESSEKAQSDVRNRITDPRDGLRIRLNRLQKIRRENSLPVSPTTARLETAARAMTRIEEKHLPAIEEAITAAKKNAAKLSDLAKKQDASARDLRAAVEELDRWAGLAEVQSEANAIAKRLRNIRETLDRLREQVPPGVAVDRLSPDARAALDRAASNLTTTEDALKKTIAKAEKVRDAKNAAGNKAESARLEKALDQAGGAAALEELRKAADSTRANRLADAEASRDLVQERVRKFEDVLAGREEGVRPDELRRKAAERAAKIAALKDKQDELAKKLKERLNHSDDDALGEEQARLAREAEALAEKADAEKAAETAETLRRAADNMGKAAEDLLKDGNAGKAAMEAAAELSKAQEQSKPKDGKSSSELARERQEELRENLKTFRDRQQAAIDESIRLSDVSAKARKWGRPLVASLVTLAEREEAIAKELLNYSEKSVKDAPVFERMLTQAAERIEQSARRIRERKDDLLTTSEFVTESEAAADEVIRRSMREALRRLDSVINALSEKPKDQAAAKSDASPMSGAGGSAQQQQQQQPPVAQLKALRDWQAEIQDRTTAFANAHADASKLTADDRAELAELQKNQAEIASLFDKLRTTLIPKAQVP